MAKFAVFIDLENCGAKVETLQSVLEKVKIRGDILLGMVYGYTDRFSTLKETLLSNTFTVVPSLRYGIAQKNNADIQLVIDALSVAYSNPLIDSFCIVSGDSDYVPLVGKLKSMGKFVLGISRSEATSNIFLNACNEFQFLEGVSRKAAAPERKGKKGSASEETVDESELNKLIVSIIDEATGMDEMYASELKGVLTRLRPDFNEKAYGCASFYKLLTKLSAKYGDIFVTATGCKDVIVERHFAVMKDNAILCNSGHFDCEVDVAKLRELAVETSERRANIIGYRMADGRSLNVLAEGRLVNLASGNGHPAEIMDMSFAVQALSLEWLAKNYKGLEKKVYDIPAEIDDQIGRVKLAAMGYAIDTLTEEQKAYLAGWEA